MTLCVSSMSPFLKPSAQCFLVACLVSCAVERIEAEQYLEVVGEIELISHHRVDTNGIPKTRTYPFTCIVGTNQWRIAHNFSSNAEDVWHFDGTNVYHRMQQLRDVARDSNSLLTFDSHIVPFEQGRSNVTIEVIPSPGGHPLGDLAVNIPWLAYCSGTYLRSPGRMIPLPTLVVRETVDSFGYVDTTAVFDDSLGLPSKLTLFTSNLRLEESLQDPRMIRWPERIQRSKRFAMSLAPDGLVAFDYNVIASTNAFGWILPKRFTYTMYRIDPNGTSSPRVGGVGKTLSVRVGNRPESVFMPDMRQTIADYRFRHDKVLVDGITYQLTNGFSLPETNDSHLLAQFKAVVTSPPYNLSRVDTRILVFLLGTIALVAPLSLLLWTAIKKNDRRKA